MKLRYVLVATALLGFATGLAAQPFPWDGRPYPRATQPSEPGPAVLLRDEVDRLIGFLGKDPVPSLAEIRRYLDAEVAPHFDFAYMARWALGPNARTLDPKERSAAELWMQDNFLAALSNHLGAYGKGGVRVSAPRRVRGNEVDVALDLLRPREGYPTRINFRFYRTRDGWKVFDVSAHGISVLAHFRRVFQRAYSQSPERIPGR